MSDLIDPDSPPEPSESSEPSEVEVSRASERDSALAAVLRYQTERAEVAAHAQEVLERRQGLGLRHLALGMAMATAIWIWIWPPVVLRITPPGPPAVEEEESSLRLVMYFQVQRIEQYLVDTGSVPLVLDDAGPAFRGMEYIRLTNRDYRVLGRARAYDDGRPIIIALTYSSVDPLDVFVGTGASVLDLMVPN